MKWLIIILMVFSHSAYSETIERYRLNGFASIKANVATDESYLGYDSGIDYKRENVLGLQLTGNLADRARVTMLVTAKGNDDYQFSVDWVYFSYILPKDWIINVGRIGTPFYLYSDVKDIGFAYDWIRLPKSVYWITYPGIDGASLYHNHEYYTVNTTLQVIQGGYDGKSTVGGLPSRTLLKDFVGMMGSVERDKWYVRLTAVKTNINVEAEALKSIFNISPPELVDDFWTNGVDAYFRGIAIRYNNGRFQALSEYTQTDIKDSFFDARSGGYISLSYCLGWVRPFIMYEHEDFKIKSDVLGKYQGLIPPPVFSALEDITRFEKSRKDTYHIGARFDRNNKLSFKVQYSQEHDQRVGGGNGLVGLSVDVVF